MRLIAFTVPYRLSPKWVVKFSETFYRSFRMRKRVSFSIARPFLSLRRVKRVQKKKNLATYFRNRLYINEINMRLFFSRNNKNVYSMRYQKKKKKRGIRITNEYFVHFRLSSGWSLRITLSGPPRGAKRKKKI